MEEIINRLSKAVATYSFEATNYPNCIVFREDLENLINKYKEQEELNNILNGTIKSLIKLGEEHMEMINLMAKDISENKLNEDICRQVKDPKNEECYAYQYDENACKDCVIEYYEKKARISNDYSKSR